MATSVPVPMAMPTSACARAGASLMPSPTMATTFPSACSRFDLGDLALGQHLGHHPVDAGLAGDRLGRAPVVAGEHDHVEAHPPQPGDRLAGARLDRVGHREQPGERAVDRHVHGRPAFAGQPLGVGPERVRMSTA